MGREKSLREREGCPRGTRERGAEEKKQWSGKEVNVKKESKE